MPLQIGIVGLPNVGKSTLFQALTKKPVLIENYPFATIDPNVGVVSVPDERLEKLAKMSKSAKVVPTVIEFVDIAGLVKNAHQGEGLGNQFLAHIREVDTIIHLVRAFEDSNIHHVDGSIDPARDEDTIRFELIMADLATVEKRLAAVEPKAKTGNKEIIALVVVYKKIKDLLEQEQWLADSALSEEERELIRDLNLLTVKPVLHIANIKTQEPQSTPTRDRGLRGRHKNLKTKEYEVLLDAKYELELSSLSKDERAELGVTDTGLDKLIKLAYQTLELITFYTFNEKETRAWTLHQGTAAPQAAGVIHTDFEQDFIRAEVINWQKLLNAGSWTEAREQGLIRTEGKDYIICDGDVIYFHTN